MLIREWMTKDVITVTPDTSMLKASKLMKDHNIRRLPVLDGKREVEQHQVGHGGENIARDMLKRFAGLDFKPGAGKDVDKLTTNGLVVLNDIDQRH